MFRSLCARSRRPAFPVRPLLEGLEDRLLPSVFVVTNTGDTGQGKGFHGDLRYTLSQADLVGGTNVIEFDHAVFSHPQTITLHSALPALTDDHLVVVGPGSELLTVSGAHANRVFTISAADVALSGLTLAQGSAPDNGGAIEFTGTGILTLASCVLTGNRAGEPGGCGGGLFNAEGTVLLSGTTLSGNVAADEGGAVANFGRLVLDRCTLSGDTATDQIGGALFNEDGRVTLSGCMLSGDTAPHGVGGAVFNTAGVLTLNHCTLLDNSALRCGGLYNGEGQVGVDNSTLTGNRGGLDNVSGVVALTNCNLNDNAVPSLEPALNNGGTLTVTRSNLTGSPRGAALYNAGQLSLTGVTLSAYSAPFGSGIDNSRGGTVVLTHSTLSDNRGGAINNYFGTVTLMDSILSGNHTTGTGGGIANYQGQVTLTDSTLSGNYAANGGGVYNAGGTLVVTDSTLSDNAAARGGALANATGGSLLVTRSTLAGNTSRFSGGGALFNQGHATLTASTLTGNAALGFLGGGGALNYGALTLINSTLAGNASANEGGGISNRGKLTLINSTLAGNTARTSGGGIANRSHRPVTLNNTLVAANYAGNPSPDIAGPVSAASGFNLIGDGTGLTGIQDGVNGNQVGTALNPIDPRLTPLGFYGGPTQTMELLPDSPALWAGSVALAIHPNGKPLTTDQRGLSRTINGTVDIGAVEDQMPSPYRPARPISSPPWLPVDLLCAGLDGTSPRHGGPELFSGDRFW